jgi:purine-binding chemotaxis protein CheW
MDQSVQLLAFRIGKCAYALPLTQVRQVIRAVEVSAADAFPEAVLGLIDFHGEAIALLNLRRRLGLPAREIRLDDQFVIASMGGFLVALGVERVTGILERPAAQVEKAEGVVPLDGDLLLINDLDQLFDRQDVQKIRELATEPVSHER